MRYDEFIILWKAIGLAEYLKANPPSPHELALSLAALHHRVSLLELRDSWRIF